MNTVLRRGWMMVATFVVTAHAAHADEPVTAKQTLTLAGARVAIGAASAVARSRHGAGVFAVVDDGGNLMAVERLDGTFAMGAKVSIGKARTAALFKKPTRFFEDLVNKGRTAMTALDDFTPLQGGVPIVVRGQIVGAIGVSGAASAKEDEELAMAGAAAVAASEQSAVRAIDQRAVAAAFTKGSPLIETAEYKIHASHRDGAGKAEVHERDTDILYFLEGTATLVTGGTVVDPKVVEAEEIRGSGIKGGESRTVAAGDVIVVPRGVPHWFQKVPGALNYYAVKVR